MGFVRRIFDPRIVILILHTAWMVVCLFSIEASEPAYLLDLPALTLFFWLPKWGTMVPTLMVVGGLQWVLIVWLAMVIRRLPRIGLICRWVGLGAVVAIFVIWLASLRYAFGFSEFGRYIYFEAGGYFIRSHEFPHLL